MERLAINTGLQGFVMPDKITHISDRTIEAIKLFDIGNFNLITKIETLAQLCALHTRILTDFESHAFLLKIDEFTDMSDDKELGEYSLTGKIKSSASTAVSYSVSAYFEAHVKFCATLIIARTDYSDTFNKQPLENHYRKIVECLTKDLHKN